MKPLHIISAVSLIGNLILAFMLLEQKAQYEQMKNIAQQERKKAEHQQEVALQQVRIAQEHVEQLRLKFQQANTSENFRRSHAQTIKTTHNTYDTYRVGLNDVKRLRILHKTKEGKLIGNFKNLKSLLKQENKELIFATNSGIFKVDQSPLGLHVEDGKKIVPLNTANGEGNFFMKPNGVFYSDGYKMAISSSNDMQKQKGHIEFATQSGPLLLQNNKIHPQFRKGSANKKLRSGVGINEKGEAVFAISKGKVNFYDFTLFFKNELHCKNALYLDGVISKMYLPELNRINEGGKFAAFIAIGRKSK